MPKLKAKGLKVLWIVHIFLTITMVGGVVCNSILLSIIPNEPSELLPGLWGSIKIIDAYCILPAGLLFLVSGLIYGFFTNWGFFKYPWIIIKWIGMFSILGLTRGFIGRNIAEVITLVNSNPAQAISNSTYQNWLSEFRLYYFAALGIMLLLVVISKIKPWSKLRINNLAK